MAFAYNNVRTRSAQPRYVIYSYLTRCAGLPRPEYIHVMPDSEKLTWDLKVPTPAGVG